MDGRGGCCIGIARYGGGVYDMSRVGRIMLKFRPIAPKPVAGGSSPSDTTPEKADINAKIGRTKRRYVRDNNIVNTKRCNRKRKVSPEETVVTLSLLPEAPARKGSPDRESPQRKHEPTVELKDARNEQMWLSFDGTKKVGHALQLGGLSDRTAVVPAGATAVGSCVIVECVTETCLDGYGLGRTDEERRSILGRDTCPGFISDVFGRVTWTNGAYTRMMDQGSEWAERDQQQVMVWLVIKEESLIRRLTYPAFTCRVRLVQYSSCGKERSSLTLPCDVWRMDGGGFAWRLDVKAALSLGR
ncbi:hypothetical protein CJ030_MR4G021007 [Morella rubra]|uniref:DUF7950 domain-containing protein n=1 Tax=Morella rubra TaxID=262757 RepID=A0A6A1VWF9_9ROSI|nr:hypothetical protein CJ030_MR4G021007 [Morella rubra]